MSPADYAAVLFDMDGTLVDTEPLWHQAEIDLFARFGLPWSVEQAKALTGSSMPATARFFQDRGVDLPAQDIIDRLAAYVMAGLRTGPVFVPETRELLRRCHAAAVPAALVTMSPRALADAVLAGLPAEAFAFTIAAEEVEHGKPHPEPYLRAAAALGVDPAQCLALEDSRPGIASALAAGCTVRSVGPLAGTIPGAPPMANVTNTSR
ncbi:HAD family hydrolase [Cumulibacter manganitolerans]|uniref:HAD family hydrolase n=1 Tax=Cumulibacter manganitolerans TaxID=1884992 RepID=UPI0012981ABB|nr:HAD family phosphatase [Cumulibacter manganitolerans]